MAALILNADVGEGVGNEHLLMPYLDACSIACGGHTGDEHTMRDTIGLAREHRVMIGAHPSFIDRAHFGRRLHMLTPEELKETLTQQLLPFLEYCQAENAVCTYVKPHGALYNLAARDAQTSQILIETVAGIDKSLQLMVPYGSVTQKMAQNNIPTLVEGFADRAYNDDYSLVPREHPNAVLYEVSKVLNHLDYIQRGEVRTLSQQILPMQIDTLCVHGDTPEALTLLKAIYKHLHNSTQC